MILKEADILCSDWENHVKFWPVGSSCCLNRD